MGNDGTIKTACSMGADLWNEIQKAIDEDDIGFSRWVQKSSKLMLKTRKIQNVREFITSLDEAEIDLLRKELKKRD